MDLVGSGPRWAAADRAGSSSTSPIIALCSDGWRRRALYETTAASTNGSAARIPSAIHTISRTRRT